MASKVQKVVNPIHGLRAFLVLDALVRLVIWSGSCILSIQTLTWMKIWPQSAIVGVSLREAWAWFGPLMQFAIFFNLWYVAFLVVLRLPIPTPKEGRYTMRPGEPIDRQLVWAMLIATLTKARYEAPFPGFLVFHAANVPPLSWLMSPIFGPKSRSCYVTDPKFMDPYGIEVGRNVVFGLGSIVSAHAQGRDDITIRKTVIEDNVILGGNVIVYDGCTIKQGAVILGGAILKSGTVVGENEIWGGIPAKKIKTLPPFGETLTADDEFTV